ncbi:MAG: SH3 domain-containing protein [Anaerolineae bacterium]|nr:SH3 domain-containing protein [Anaerolineae bacterium]
MGRQPIDGRAGAVGRGALGLWVESGGVPVSSVEAFPPPTVLVCQTIDGNNIRQGPGTEYAVVTQSTAQMTYEVFQVQTLTSGGTPGDWYHVRWPGSADTGWLWADLMSTCALPE